MQGDGTQPRCRPVDEFRIGDFVWGKIHGHSWWPGQVCEPSEASEQARCLEHVEPHVLVAYFGDNTFAWCEVSLLKPFKEEFQHMVEQNNSQSFVDAVKDAMYEVERCLRLDMTCYCVPPEKVVQLRMGRENYTCNASVSNYGPVAFLNHLQSVAQDISVANMLDVTLMRSWAASFSLRNGCFIKMIEDLFGEKQTDLSAFTRKLFGDKHGREVQVNSGRVDRRPHMSRDEASRKKRSMAELIRLPDPELLLHSGVKEMHGAFEDDMKSHKQPDLLLSKIKKTMDREKLKVPVVEVINVTHEEENGSTRRERRKSKYLSPPYTSGYRGRSNSFKLVDSGASEIDSENSLNLQTKFTTYCDNDQEDFKECDPATYSSMCTEASSHDILGKLLFAASNPLHLVRNTVREFFVTHRNFAYTGVLGIEGFPMQPGDSRTSGYYPLHEMLAGSKVQYRRKRNNCKHDPKRENVLGINHNGEKLKKGKSASETPKSDYSPDSVDSSRERLRSWGKQGKDEADRRSVEKLDHMAINSLEEGRLEERNKTRYVVKDGNVGQSGNKHFISCCHKRKSGKADISDGEHKIDLEHVMHNRTGIRDLRSKRAKKVECSNESSVALLLTFSPGSTLPSKDELFLVFSKYGDLIKHETELFRDPGCARVVFARETDATKALNGIRKNTNFPFSVANCQSFDIPQCPDIPSQSESNPSAELICISQSLQRMIRALSPKKGLDPHGLKPEARKDLINDIKGLLNKVNKLIT